MTVSTSWTCDDTYDCSRRGWVIDTMRDISTQQKTAVKFNNYEEFILACFTISSHLNKHVMIC